MILMGFWRAKVCPNKNHDCLLAGCKVEKYVKCVSPWLWNVSV